MNGKYLVCFFVFIHFACSTKEDQAPDDGYVREGIYQNDFFNFSITIPKDWNLLDSKEQSTLMKAGREEVDSLNDNFQDVKRDDRIRQLLLLFQFKPGTEEGFNPSFIIMAEKVPSAPSNFDERAYLALTREQLSATGQYDSMDNKLQSREIDGKKFYSLKVKTIRNETAITQEFFTSIIRGHVLIVILSYADVNQGQKLHAILSDVKF